MATQNQIEANRRNAKNSTGPTSPEGKATSSMNALKTGIDATSELLSSENPEAHAALIAEYYDRFQPTTPEERCLVDRLISSEWLHRRYQSVEGALWQLQLDGMSKPSLGKAYVYMSEQLGRVDRRLNSAQRNFDKALKELRALQAKRPAQQQLMEALPASETAVATEQVKPELGSFLISINERPNQQATIEISPYTPPNTVPETENEEPDLPQAA